MLTNIMLVTAVILLVCILSELIYLARSADDTADFTYWIFKLLVNEFGDDWEGEDTEGGPDLIQTMDEILDDLKRKEKEEKKSKKNKGKTGKILRGDFGKPYDNENDEDDADDTADEDTADSDIKDNDDEDKE